MLRTALALAGLAGILTSQQFVAEIDAAPAVAASADARHALVVGNHVWFTARTPDAGFELHRSDGTVAGTRRLLDLGPGTQSATARPLVEVNGRLLFTAFDALANVQALWATDGTAAGTVRLTTAITSTDPLRLLGVVNGRALFVDRAPLYLRLWSTDLTPAGTFIIGPLGSVITPAWQRSAELLFLATTSNGIPALWSTDGLTVGFRHGLGGGTGSAGFAVLGNRAYFTVFRQGQSELWSTDGNQPGTTLITTIGAPHTPGDSIAAAGGQLLVIGGNQLFRSDGTAAGTVLLAPQWMSSPRQVTAVGNLVFFTAFDPSTGFELWRTDGTLAGTFLVCDANPASGGTESSRYEMLTDVQGRLFCFVYATFSYLLSSDGTVAGTQLLRVASDPMYSTLGALGQEAVGAFGLSPLQNTELFATNGTLAGTRQLTANRQVPGVMESASSAALGETLYFVARDAAHGRELWRSDGTAAGTSLVLDRVPGTGDGLDAVVEHQGALWFGSRTGELWRSDGTAAGTMPVLQPVPGASALSQIKSRDGTLLFVTSAPFLYQLWRSDGTAAGTSLLATANQSISQPEVAGNLVFYLATSFYQVHLFCTDGTPQGTVDLGPAGAVLGVLGNRVVFMGGFTGSNVPVFTTDGTVAGTVQLHNGPGPVGWSGPLGNRLFWNDTQGQLLVTDGVSVITLPVPSVSQPPVIAGDRAYVVTASASAGRALYVTDGTAAGTTFVAAPGIGLLGGALEVQALGNRAFLTAEDGSNGAEPWISDGTAAGTRLLADLHPTGNSNPQLLGVAGTKALFVADDGVRGRELWRLDLQAVGAANTQAFGAGCIGMSGTPRLQADGLPVIGSRTFGLLLDRGRPLTAAVWVAGTGTGLASLGGACSLLLANPSVVTLQMLDAAGTARLALPIPGNAGLIGFALAAQAVVVDAQGASPLGLSASQGLFVVVGS